MTAAPAPAAADDPTKVVKQTSKMVFKGESKQDTIINPIEAAVAFELKGTSPEIIRQKLRCEECDNNKYYKRVEFRWFGKATKVYFTSNFMKWSSMIEMTPVLDGFLVCFVLSKGHYEFKYQVDGKWCVNKEYATATSLIGETVNCVHV